MIGTLKKIFAFAGGRKNLLKKSLFFSLLNGIFASFQFGALYFIVDALASDDHSPGDDGTFHRWPDFCFILLYE